MKYDVICGWSLEDIPKNLSLITGMGILSVETRESEKFEISTSIMRVGI